MEAIYMQNLFIHWLDFARWQRQKEKCPLPFYCLCYHSGQVAFCSKWTKRFRHGCLHLSRFTHRRIVHASHHMYKLCRMSAVLQYNTGTLIRMSTLRPLLILYNNIQPRRSHTHTHNIDKIQRDVMLRCGVLSFHFDSVTRLWWLAYPPLTHTHTYISIYILSFISKYFRVWVIVMIRAAIARAFAFIRSLIMTHSKICSAFDYPMRHGPMATMAYTHKHIHNSCYIVYNQMKRKRCISKSWDSLLSTELFIIINSYSPIKV